MPKISPFQIYTGQYENWFTDHRWVYDAELRAVRALLPENSRGLEVGVGTGRFAEPLGIKTGLEPSVRMREIARNRGINVLAGVAEDLPFGNAKFDLVLMVTTVCFLDDTHKAFREAHRVLANGGFFIAGIVDRNSLIGQKYLKHQNESVFYKIATFFSVDEVANIMRQAGFTDFMFRQMIFQRLSEIDDKEPVKSGYCHHRSSFSSKMVGLFKNKVLIGVILTFFIVSVGAVYIPAMNKLFETTPLRSV